MTQLKRELGLFGSVMMGLGSIIGTGVFVSIGIAAGITGPSVVLSIIVAAGVACCNAFSSAQLAANHPVSGGTYEYGYTYLNPLAGFIAGWMFLCAKTASAATAALGFSGYFLYSVFGVVDRLTLISVAVGVVGVFTGVVLLGLQRTHYVNTIIVVITLLSLILFVCGGAPLAIHHGSLYLHPLFNSVDQGSVYHFLQATALMFVAYTGYGRIATLGEEVVAPRRTIPRAIIITLGVSAVLYIGVGLVSVMAVGTQALRVATEGQVAMLEVVARQFSFPYLHWIISLGAMTAMLGVLLNLIVGLSRTLLAMGRRGDMPACFTTLNKEKTTPYVAVLGVGIMIIGLTCLGSIKLAWSFSAFTVLIYYSITNLCALRLNPTERLYAPVFAWGGLGSCLFLACWVDAIIWKVGIGLIVLGILMHSIRKK